MSKNFVDNDNATALMGSVANKINHEFFTGTEEEFDALPLSEKIKYKHTLFKDDMYDFDPSELVDEATLGLMKPITSNAVAKGLDDKADANNTYTKNEVDTAIAKKQYCVKLTLSSSVISDAATAFEYIWRNYAEETVRYGVSFSIVNGVDWYTGEVYSDLVTDQQGKTCWGWVIKRSDSVYNEQFYKCFYQYGVGSSAVPLSTTVVQKQQAWTFDSTNLPAHIKTLTTPDGSHRNNWSLQIIPCYLSQYWVNYTFNVYQGTSDNEVRIFCLAAFDGGMQKFNGTQTLYVDLVWTHV